MRLICPIDDCKGVNTINELVHRQCKTYRPRFQASFAPEQVPMIWVGTMKTTKPGQSSPHVMRLRQQQAAARQASSLSRQSFIGMVAAFFRDARTKVPWRMALEMFITHWIGANVLA